MICRALIAGGSQDIAMQILQKLYLKGPDETGTESNALKLAVYSDQMTTISQWHDIVKVAQEYGYEEVTCISLFALQYTYMHGSIDC